MPFLPSPSRLLLIIFTLFVGLWHMKQNHQVLIAKMTQIEMNQLTDVDLLVGYGLAAYVLEAHADRAPKILGRLAGEAAVTVLEEELDTKLDRLQRDLTEWLGEVH